MTEKKIAWGICGAGHFLPETVALIKRCPNTDVFLSEAALEVLKMYHLYDELEQSGVHIIKDRSASARSVTHLYNGDYDLTVIAPLSGNSMAKMVYGIADTLVTNLFAHSGKCYVPTLLLPCDSLTKVVSTTPNGSLVDVSLRGIEADNLYRLTMLDNVTLAYTPEELELKLKDTFEVVMTP